MRLPVPVGRFAALSFACAASALPITLGCASSDDAASSSDERSSALESAGCVAAKLAEQARACDARPPSVRAEGFVGKKPDGDATHRGRDMFFAEGEAQWILAKFSYGAIDDRLKDEPVDVFVLPSCGSEWKKLARVTTSGRDHSDRKVEGFEDDEGRVLYQIPRADRLPVGRHRVRLVAAADGSATELFIEVVPRGTKLAVIDIDGTLNLGLVVEEAFKVFDATSPARADSPEALRALAERGYRPYYLSARADLDVERTREFIRAHDMPAGVIQTTPLLVGVFGKPATVFKEQALDAAKARGLEPAIAFGNQKSDAEAFDHAAIPRARRFFYGFDDDRYGGRRFDSYSDLLPELRAMPSTCRR